ncbi:MAG: putative bifunctional diguanylate cyclase/phosphodiesterase [Lysobacter sp.]
MTDTPMKYVHGLQAKVLLMMLMVLAMLLVLFGLLLHRQGRMQDEVVGVSHAVMQDMASENLQRRGEGMVMPLAESLANPLYYHDLDEIGRLVRGAQGQPGVAYVLVFDSRGSVLHDGSDEIPDYGQKMSDPLAQGAIHAVALNTQFNDSIMDVSAPILMGSERLGGIRIGYGLASLRAVQKRAAADLHHRVVELGQRQLLWMSLFGLGFLAMGAGAVWSIQRWLVRPIRELADSARAIEAGQFDTRTPASSRNDELGDLMRAFRRMSESIFRHDHDIRAMAYTDALTGQANRLAFREALDLRLQRLSGTNRQLALLFADLDDFKRVNDTLGHDVGDEALLVVSGRIREAVERIAGEGALLARFGGDEFVVLIESLDEHVDVRTLATDLAEVLVEELSAPLSLQGRDVFLGISIGISMFPDDADTAATLMKTGDVAMYQAKVAGKNCTRYYSRDLNQAVERYVYLEGELRGAWERGELSMAYQPIYRMADDTLLGAEALLRWNHPELGLVAPEIFIDVAEQSGLIEVIGPQVLTAACRDAALWPQPPDSEPLFVSVNVSSRQLRSGDLPRIVAESLSHSGLPPQRLHVELTETAMIGDEAHASRMLQQLRATGVRVWLDDFGTGFSGLSHLRRVPVDGVKIDHSFVADILHDADDLALTTAVIAMAHSLGIAVVGEGIENEAQYALLRDRGCDMAQGFWLGYPMAMGDFLAVLKKQTVPAVEI